MLDEFSVEQMMVDPSMPAEAFLYIFESCERGVESSDSWIRTHACSTINNICTSVIGETEKADLFLRHEPSADPTKSPTSPTMRKNRKKSQQQGAWFLEYLNRFPHVLHSLLTTLFGLILFDDNNDQWQLSRPLYTLVLLQRDVSKFFFSVVFALHYTNNPLLTHNFFFLKFAAKYTNQVILQQLPERREFVTKVSLD